MKKNIVYTVLAFVALTMGSCEFLDKMPDQRTQIDSKEKVAKLLVSGYTDANYGLMGELSSDNMIDNNAYRGLTEAAFDVFYDEAFAWQDVVSGTAQDSPNYIWQGCYSAIAVANAALDAIREISIKDPTIDLSAERAEAKLIRAYHHFILVNIFSHAYISDEESKNDLGIPYMEESEKVVFGEYERLSVTDVYKKIEKDLVEGIDSINDGLYTVPKYHFNKKAAHAFAARFYLYKRDYKKVIEHANQVLGGSPAAAQALLRDGQNIKEVTTYPDNEVYEWISVDRDCNLLILPTNSYMTMLFFYPKYGVNGDAQTAIVKCNGPNWSSPFPGFNFWSMGANYGGFAAKVYYLFEYTDKISGTGYYHVVRPELTTNETLLCLAEALVYENQPELALQYLQAWTTMWGVKDPLEVNKVKSLYSSATGTAYAGDLSNAAKMGNKIPAGYEYLIKCILHFRRIETVHDGLRWFDIKRYGIEITHDISGQGKKTLPWNDERRAIQLPQDVIVAGIKENPRSTDNKGTSGSFSTNTNVSPLTLKAIPLVNLTK